MDFETLSREIYEIVSGRLNFWNDWQRREYLKKLRRNLDRDWPDVQQHRIESSTLRLQAEFKKEGMEWFGHDMPKVSEGSALFGQGRVGSWRGGVEAVAPS